MTGAVIRPSHSGEHSLNSAVEASGHWLVGRINWMRSRLDSTADAFSVGIGTGTPFLGTRPKYPPIDPNATLRK